MGPGTDGHRAEEGDPGGRGARRPVRVMPTVADPSSRLGRAGRAPAATRTAGACAGEGVGCGSRAAAPSIKKERGERREGGRGCAGFYGP